MLIIRAAYDLVLRLAFPRTPALVGVASAPSNPDQEETWRHFCNK